jgi:hypothetical protein
MYAGASAHVAGGGRSARRALADGRRAGRQVLAPTCGGQAGAVVGGTVSGSGSELGR